MLRLNEDLRSLPADYLFTRTARCGAAWQARHPGETLLSLGVGDVRGPLPEAASAAMTSAARELKTASGFRGYGPEQGYPFLRKAIAGTYRDRGVDLDMGEVFITDGSKTDCGGLLDLFHRETVTAVCEPVYPAYVDDLILSGRAGKRQGDGSWSQLRYLPAREENGFVPPPPEGDAGLVWLCYPNNPTGTAATGEELRAWVDWANCTGAVLLFDGAYESFITTPGVPRSIYEVPGADRCAIEVRSFSKTAGFTGVRCGYTVIPAALERQGGSLQALWKRRQSARFNGVSYVTQRGAEAVCAGAGRRQAMEQVAAARSSAARLRAGVEALGLRAFGGVDAPYVWVRTPQGLTSWAFFDLLLEEAGVLVTPGAGFGPSGEGYVRLSGFGGRAEEALDRIRRVLSES